MGLSRHANARDANERVIVNGLRSIGASVYRVNEPCDIIVGFRRVNYLFEIKLPLGPKGGASHSAQTADQVQFEQTWRGQYAVVRSLDEAIAIVSAGLPPPWGGEAA